jgi:hypothetical protein
MSTESIIEKIKKLLALSKNAGTEAEAANAAARAQELIDKHHITEAQLQSGPDKAKEEPIEDHPLEGGTNPESWHWKLADVLALAFYCRIYRCGPQLHVVGRETDRQVVSYLFRFLMNEIARIGSFRWAARGTPDIEDFFDIDAPAPAVQQTSEGEWMEGFRLGAVARLSERLGERKMKLPPGMTEAHALVLKQRDDAVVEWLKRLRLVPAASRPSRFSTEGYGEGRAAASAMHIGAEGSRSKQLGK